MSNNGLKISTPVAIIGAFGFIFGIKFLKEITKAMFQPKQDNIFKQRRVRQTKNRED